MAVKYIVCAHILDPNASVWDDCPHRIKIYTIDTTGKYNLSHIKHYINESKDSIVCGKEFLKEIGFYEHKYIKSIYSDESLYYDASDAGDGSQFLGITHIDINMHCLEEYGNGGCLQCRVNPVVEGRKYPIVYKEFEVDDVQELINNSDLSIPEIIKISDYSKSHKRFSFVIPDADSEIIFI